MSSSFYCTNKSMVLTCFCWNHTPPFFSCKPAPCSPGRVSIRYQTSSITWVADTSTILPKKLQSFLVTSTTIPIGNVSLTMLVNSFCNYHSYWKNFTEIRGYSPRCHFATLRRKDSLPCSFFNWFTSQVGKSAAK